MTFNLVKGSKAFDVDSRRPFFDLSLVEEEGGWGRPTIDKRRSEDGWGKKSAQAF